jgi:hypothetical protein
MNREGSGMKPYAFFLVGGILLLASLWSLLWIFSSASLASSFCDSKFDLFHEHFRCRQPYIASILFVLFGVLTVISFYLGLRARKSIHRGHP